MSDGSLKRGEAFRQRQLLCRVGAVRDRLPCSLRVRRRPFNLGSAIVSNRQAIYTCSTVAQRRGKSEVYPCYVDRDACYRQASRASDRVNVQLDCTVEGVRRPIPRRLLGVHSGGGRKSNGFHSGPNGVFVRL